MTLNGFREWKPFGTMSRWRVSVLSLFSFRLFANTHLNVWETGFWFWCLTVTHTGPYQGKNYPSKLKSLIHYTYIKLLLILVLGSGLMKEWRQINQEGRNYKGRLSGSNNNNNSNNKNILYSSQREIKAVVRSHNEEHHISIILSHETHAHTHS